LQKEQKILLADDTAPKEYKIQTLFKTDLLPKQKASHFSNPTIPYPKIEVTNGKVTIILDVSTPKFYDILIEKQYYATHNNYDTHSTLYKGHNKNTFFDEIEEGKACTYAITPIYKNIKGKTLFLPTVFYSNGQSKFIPTTPPDISNKDWWNY
jgi:hypothetical protein